MTISTLRGAPLDSQGGGAGVFVAGKLFISTGLGGALKISHFVTCLYGAGLEVNYLFHAESAQNYIFQKYSCKPNPPLPPWESNGGPLSAKTYMSVKCTKLLFQGKKAMLSVTLGGAETAFTNRGMMGDINAFLWQIQVIEVQNTLTRERARVGTQRHTEKSRDCPHTSAMTRATFNATCEAPRLSRCATKINSFNPFKPDFTLSSSSTTSRELLSQFSTCSG